MTGEEFIRMRCDDPKMQDLLWIYAERIRKDDDGGAALASLTMRGLAKFGFKPVEMQLAIIAERFNALQVSANGNDVWIDRSMLKLVAWRRVGQDGTFLIPEHLALEKGLL